jgi:uncharacterized protein (TIGR02145 family)
MKWIHSYKKESFMNILSRVLLVNIAIILLSVFGCGEVGSGSNSSGSDILTDSRDNKKYKTVNIGNLIWMAENLNYKPSTGNFWCYDNDDSNCEIYGYLYDWNAATTVCPQGWRLPSMNEWRDLVQNSGGSTAGTRLKSAIEWDGTNDYGFSALPGGDRPYTQDGRFLSIGISGSWWSSTEDEGDFAYNITIHSGQEDVLFQDNGIHKFIGLSVRCIK